MQNTSFAYQTITEDLSELKLVVERFRSLDETIDQYFAAYEKTGDPELFESLCPYFGVIWPAGLELARYCLTRAEEWSRGSILELGCGLALPSLALAKRGCRVIASDFHPDVPFFLETNSRHNSVRIPYARLDWREPLPSVAVVIGSDLVYDRRQPEAIVRLLAESQWCEAVIADPGRPYWDSFLALARERWVTEEFLRGGIFFARLSSKNA